MSIITLNTGTAAHIISQGQDVQQSVNLNKLSDVTLVNVQDDQILKYNTTTNQWENVNAGEITLLELDDLTDVTITSVSTGEFIRWSGSEWENTDNIDGGTF